MQIPEITVSELNVSLASPHPPTLIDVREAEELEISRFDNYRHVPMSEIPARMHELDREDDLVIVCRSGNRSARVTAYLLSAGFTKVRNLAGGINEWARLIEPTLSRY